VSSTLNETTKTGDTSSPRSADPAAPAGSRTAFVPLSKDRLIDVIVRHGKLADLEAQFRALCHRIEAVIHCEFHTRQEQLKRLYAPFDPDSDVRPVQCGGNASRWDTLEEFLGGLIHVLDAANFRPLSDKELERALSGSTYWGLDLQINREIFDRLMIFVRGEGALGRVRADLGTWFRPREVELEVFDRLVLIVKLKSADSARDLIDSDSVYLKMFREIPKLDIEMLLPGTKPRMRWADTAKIGSSSVGGFYGLIKMIFSQLVGMKLTWLMLALGAFSYAWQSFVGYRRTKADYIHSMTEQLYYLNLDNNTGVFCRLIDEAEDEETKETILSYYLLWRWPDEPWTPDRLASEAEKLLMEQTGERCAFQAREAIAKLERLGLLRHDRKEMRVLEPHEASANLGERAVRFFGDGTVA
jgi:hypothetical protein